MNKLIFTKKDAAKKLAVTVETVDNLIAGDHLKTVTIGKRTLVTLAEINRFLASLAG